MRGQILFISTLLTSAVIAQAPPSATGAESTTQMATPPPVSGLSYAAQVGSEARHNYLRGGITYSTSYIDNFFANSGSEPVSETTMSILPTIALDASTERQHVVMTYSPGFTFYRPSSGLNEFDNAAAVDYSFRLFRHTTLTVTDRFEDSSSPFSPTDAGTGISGTPVSTTPGVVPPFAKRLTNGVSGEITSQTGLNEMIGASGLSTILHYPNPSQTPGLYDSSSYGGTAFYNHRFFNSQYAGVSYQFLDMLTTPTDGKSSTQTSTVMGFYTIYPKARISVSVAGGPQYYRVTETTLQTVSSWAPAVAASMGWRTGRVSSAASYSHSVTGAGGLIGAYSTNSANAALSWQLARRWTTGVSGAYSINKSVSALLPTQTGNGHTITGSATLQHQIFSQLGLAFGYDRVHQSYSQVAAISANPDSDRFSVSLTWNFQRQLGN